MTTEHRRIPDGSCEALRAVLRERDRQVRALLAEGRDVRRAIEDDTAPSSFVDSPCPCPECHFTEGR